MITQGELQDRLGELAAEHGVPGAAATVVDGEETLTAVTGTANLATGQPVVAGTMFAAGSVTKVFSTALLMTLVDDGSVDLDAPVRRYLPEFTVRGAERECADITVRMLLNHTSGLPGSFMPDVPKSPGMLADQMRLLRDRALNSPPGRFWSYSNAGMLVGGRIVEVVTGDTWDDALADRVLRPLGLRATTSTDEMILGPTAVGHLVDPVSGCRVVPRFQLDRGNGPAGTTLWCDIDALAGFARMHLDGGRAPSGGQVLAPESVAAMQEVTVTLPPGVGVDAWGLGWSLRGTGPTTVLGHTGGNAGQHSVLSVVPARRGVVAVLTNSVTGAALAAVLGAELLQRCFGIDGPEPVTAPDPAPEADLDRYVGVYEADEGSVVISRRNGGLRVEHEVDPGFREMMNLLLPSFPPPPMTLTPAGPDLFAGDMGAAVSFFGGDASGPPEYAQVGRIFRRRC